MKKLFQKLTAAAGVALALVTACAFAGCASPKGNGGVLRPDGGWGGADISDSAGGISGGDFSYDPVVPDGGFEYVPDGGSGDTGNPEVSGKPQNPVVKQLTAAAWNDAINYDDWLGLFQEQIAGEQEEEEITRKGLFYAYGNAMRGLDSREMHAVDVTSGGNPVANAKVTLYDGQQGVVYSAVSDSAGRAYVFGSGAQVAVTSGQYQASAALAEGVTSVELTNSAAAENELEILLVVDTTGSMGDELSFLCKELTGVVTRISDALDCKIRLGLLFYRDEGDAYLTRKYEFVDVSTEAGLNKAVLNIKGQSAGGGGDTPEAVDVALSEAVSMDWHSDSKTRLIFHVLDAPYHDEQAHQSRFADAVKSAAQQGIRIIPVAASGLDTLGQFTMRSAALLTGGTYAFLTDDSGIGDSHDVPAVGQYTVEYLSDLMVRLTTGYYNGAFDEPIDWRQSESVV